MSQKRTKVHGTGAYTNENEDYQKHRADVVDLQKSSTIKSAPIKKVWQAAKIISQEHIKIITHNQQQQQSSHSEIKKNTILKERSQSNIQRPGPTHTAAIDIPPKPAKELATFIKNSFERVFEFMDEQREVNGVIMEKLTVLDEKQTRLENAVSSVRNANRRASTRRPDYLPLKTKEEFRHLENISEADFDCYVAFLKWLGGTNPVDCANIYFKQSMTDELSQQLTWKGTKTQLALKDSKFLEILRSAMDGNQHFPNVNCDVFQDVIVKALNSAKERLRKARKASQQTSTQVPPNTNDAESTSSSDNELPPQEASDDEIDLDMSL